MKITRENYEIYFIDWLEGNLDSSLENEFELFLTQNPDLKEELNAFDDNISLEAEELSFENKSKLKQIPSESFFEISDDEYLCIADIEGDISKEEKVILTKKLTQNRIKRIYSALKVAQLKPDTSIIFAKKKELKKFYISARIKRGLYTVASVAAAILLYFSIASSTNEEQQNFKADNFAKIDKEIKEKSQFNNEELAIKTDSEGLNNQEITNKNKRKSKKEIATNSNNENPITENTEPKIVEENYSTLQYTAIEARPTELISAQNINEILIKRGLKEQVILQENSAEANRFWTYTEKTVTVFKAMTASEFEMRNTYRENGSLNQLELTAGGVNFRKTFKQRNQF